MKVEFIFLLYIFFMVNSTEKNKLIIDYFVYKNTPSVVLFSCYNNEGDISLLRNFNKIGIKVAFASSNNRLKAEHLINSDYWKIGILVDLNCYDDDFIIWLFLEASRNCYYGEIHHWLILSLDIESVIAMIQDVQFGLSTDFVVAIPRNASDNYQLYDIYNPWKDGGGQFNVTPMGFWNLYTGLNITLKQSKFHRRSNLHGITMKAAFVPSKYRLKNTSLDEYLQEYTSTSKEGISKFGYIMIKHFSEMFNITIRFEETRVWLPGDSLGPLARALVNQEIQITGHPAVINEERLPLIKYVYPTWPFRTCFIFRNPQSHNIKVAEVFRPLSSDCWYLTSIFLLVFVIVLGITLRFEKDELSTRRFSNSFLLVSGAMFQQGTHFSFKRLFSRIIFLHVLIFSLLMYNYYSVSIVSVRLNEPIIKIKDSMNEMSKTDLKYGSEPMVYFEFLMKRIPLRERKNFWDRWLKIPESKRFLYPEKAIPMVKEGGFAYHTHPDTSYPLIERTFSSREICELMEVHVQPPTYFSLAVNYNSTIIEMSKIGFAKMSEVGIRNRQLKRWTSRKPQCRNDEMSVSSTDMYEFAPYLIVLVIGMLAAFVIFWIEKAIADFTLRKRIKKRNHSTILLFAENFTCNTQINMY